MIQSGIGLGEHLRAVRSTRSLTLPVTLSNQPDASIWCRKENSHFLSLLAVGAVIMTVFFLFVGTSHHHSPYVEGGPELTPPTSRSQYLEARPFPSSSLEKKWVSVFGLKVRFGSKHMTPDRSTNGAIPCNQTLCY